MGGLGQWYGRVCGGPHLARNTRVMVAPMAAGTRWEEGLSSAVPPGLNFAMAVLTHPLEAPEVRLSAN